MTERWEDVGEVFGELRDRVGVPRGRIRPAMSAVVVADDPDPVAPLPGEVTDLAGPGSSLEAEAVKEYDRGLGVAGSWSAPPTARRRGR